MDDATGGIPSDKTRSGATLVVVPYGLQWQLIIEGAAHGLIRSDSREQLIRLAATLARNYRGTLVVCDDGPQRATVSFASGVAEIAGDLEVLPSVDFAPAT